MNREHQKNIVIPIVKGQKLLSGIPVIAGFMPAGVLVPRGYAIPYYRHGTEKGYQREPQESRIRQLAHHLDKNQTDLPTAILLNLRGKNAAHAIKDDKLNLKYVASQEKNSKFYIVDGQHRVLALKNLIEEDEERWAGFLIPFVCMLGADETEEMTQFHIVNSTAKSVKTDLSNALLQRRSEKDPKFSAILTERGQRWKTDAQMLVEKLAENSGVWKSRIHLPGMPKANTVMPSASMVTSLKELLDGGPASTYFGGLTKDNQIDILDAYWQGIRGVLPEAFKKPAKYTLQKGIGVLVMHGLLPHVLERVRSSGDSLRDPQSYKGVIKHALSELEGENGEGIIVKGLDFWATKPEGAAGSYSSSAGRRVLITKLRAVLPPIKLK